MAEELTQVMVAIEQLNILHSLHPSLVCEFSLDLHLQVAAEKFPFMEERLSLKSRNIILFTAN